MQGLQKHKINYRLILIGLRYGFYLAAYCVSLLCVWVKDLGTYKILKNTCRYLETTHEVQART